MAENERVVTRLSDLVAAREARENRRISYRVLADEAGVNTGTVQSWMTNTVTRFDAVSILAFCRYFDCEVSDLLQISTTAPEKFHYRGDKEAKK